ncbi:MAG: hypothetical protein Q9169_002015 [Polycauliona sp. 2 TL-2023]
MENPIAPSSTVLPRHVAVGMNTKKLHEVSNLARYVDRLSSELSSKDSCEISHFVDFGSGQNYLGRTLASPPYNKRVIALESKQLNISGAKGMDVTAKLAKKDTIIRNKKQYRNELYGKHYTEKTIKQPLGEQLLPCRVQTPSPESEHRPTDQDSNIQYIETMIHDGNLSSTLAQISQDSSSSSVSQPPKIMVISLHSCGNLLHHGLRSLILNPFVRAVALVGCCYNLLTERLPPLPGSPSSKLRAPNARLTETSSTCDPHGFPMSNRFLQYKHASGDEGIRFNITARMMAVQAPRNWTQADCSSFFTKHFYRALFQRILLDKGIIDNPNEEAQADGINEKHHPKREEEGKTKKSEPIILGSLRKPAYASFLAYVRAAIAKLSTSPSHSASVIQNLAVLTDEEILSYETKYAHKKKELSIVWSLMAFSAQVVESAIVVDRWCWLKEQEGMKEAWVENVFDYGISPRNLIVVGVRG